MILTIFLAYIVISVLAFYLLYARFKKNESEIDEKINRIQQNNIKKNEVLTERTFLPKQDTGLLNQEAKQHIEDDKKLSTVLSPDKDKPFAKMSAPSPIEKVEYTQSVEKPVVKKKRRKKPKNNATSEADKKVTST